MEEKKSSFFDTIKAKEEKAQRADQINKKNQELSTLLIIFYVTWVAAGVYLVDFMTDAHLKIGLLFVWSFAILLPLMWK